MKSFGIWVLIGISAVVIGGVLLLQPISRTKDTPLMRALSSIHGISAKLKSYADEHSSFPGGAKTNASIEALSTIGILSTNDVAYLRDHGVKYYGSDLSHIAPDVPVFEMVFTNANRLYHIVSYSDGHTAVPDLHKKP
jgi:hypothetical protein